MHDLVIRNGTVVDGTGAPGIRADVAVDGDRITAVGTVPEPGRREIDAIGLVPASAVVDGCVVRMPKAYPVYDASYRDRVAVVRRWLDRFDNLELAGRNGMHKYNNQDHSMMTALLAARNILGLGSYDTWRVNTDAEYHEQGGDDEAADAAGRAVPRRVEAA